MLEREEGRKPENTRRVMNSPLKKSRKGSEVLLKLSCTHFLYIFLCSALRSHMILVFIFLWFPKVIFMCGLFLRGERTNLTVFKQLSENVFKDRFFIYIVKKFFFSPRSILKGRKTERSENTHFLDNDWLFISTSETTEMIRSWGACNLSHVCERSCGEYWLFFLFAFHLNIELYRDVI